MESDSVHMMKTCEKCSFVISASCIDGDPAAGTGWAYDDVVGPVTPKVGTHSASESLHCNFGQGDPDGFNNFQGLSIKFPKQLADMGFLHGVKL